MWNCEVFYFAEKNFKINFETFDMLEFFFLEMLVFLCKWNKFGRVSAAKDQIIKQNKILEAQCFLTVKFQPGSQLI